MNITASQVNELRKMTGAGMMDCKHALVEAEGDVQKAIDILRKKGQKVASKRADRDANEGKIIAKVSPDGTFGAMIMLNCETDFVANTPDFMNLANSIIDVAIANHVTSLEDLNNQIIDGVTVADRIIENTGKTGEKNTLAHYLYLESELVNAYNHLGDRVATLVAMNKAGEQSNTVAHELAMQVAAMAPIAVDEQSIPADVIEREMEIAREQVRQEGKPENMVDKIAEGKLKKFFKENTLLDQIFVRDGKISVSDYIKSVDKELKVKSFYRLILGA